MREEDDFNDPVTSALLFGLAILLPLVALFPAEVRTLLPGDGAPTAAAPKVMLLSLVGGRIVLLGGLTLTGSACSG